jgi:hypothetical protein
LISSSRSSIAPVSVNPRSFRARDSKKSRKKGNTVKVTEKAKAARAHCDNGLPYKT